MSELHDKQVRFAKAVPLLITKAFELGFEVVGAEWYRTPEQAALNAKTGSGIVNSLHCDRLAIDLLLFRAGTFLGMTENYRELGEYWESLAPDHAWGGRFERADGDHFSLMHNGRR
jgi:hypothetical protein